MSWSWGRFAWSKARQGDSLRHQISAPCPHSPPTGFTLIGALDRSDWEKWSTLKKGGPVFFKLLWLDWTDPLSFGPKCLEILVEWIAHNVSNIIFFTQYPLTPSREEVLRIYKMVNKGKMLQSLFIMYVDNGLQGLTAFYFFNSAQCQEIPLSSTVSNKPSNFCRV